MNVKQVRVVGQYGRFWVMRSCRKGVAAEICPGGGRMRINSPFEFDRQSSGSMDLRLRLSLLAHVFRRYITFKHSSRNNGAAWLLALNSHEAPLGVYMCKSSACLIASPPCDVQLELTIVEYRFHGTPEAMQHLACRTMIEEVSAPCRRPYLKHPTELGQAQLETHPCWEGTSRECPHGGKSTTAESYERRQFVKESS